MRQQWGLLLVVVILAVLVASITGLVSGFISGRVLSNPASRPRIKDTTTVVRQIQSLSQLVTVKYVMEKVVVIEDPRWYGGNRLIMVAHGVAKSGFDLSRLRANDIKVDGTHLVINLPKPYLTDVYLDDRRTEVVERSTGILRVFDTVLEQDARRQAVDKMRAAAVEGGILKEAEERARLQLTALARQMGFEEVEVNIRKVTEQAGDTPATGIR